MNRKLTQKIEEAEAVIDALGGPSKVAALCEIKQPSVSEWKRYGIPPARRMYLKAVRPAAFMTPRKRKAG